MAKLLLCFAIPVLSYFRIKLVGELSLTEVVLFFLLASNVGKIRSLLGARYFTGVCFLLFAWFVAAVASDLYRGTPPGDYLRGWAKICMLGVMMVAVAILVESDPRRIVAFAMGQFSALFLYSLVYPVDLPYYKFVVGTLISGGAFTIAACLPQAHRAVTSSLPLLAGAGALLCNARSLAGVTLLATAYPWFFRDKGLRKKLLDARAILAMVAMALSAILLLQIYKYTARHGLLGEEAMVKYEEQASDGSGDFSIFKGRNEVFFTIPKITASPLIGWGSWPRDADFVYDRCVELALPMYIAEEDLVPTHSHFLGAWAEAGFIGALFWGVIFFFTVRALWVNGFCFMGAYRVFGVFLAIMLLWDIVFSPFGGERRVFNGFLIWVVLLAQPAPSARCLARASSNAR